MKSFKHSAFAIFFRQLPRLLLAGVVFSAFFAAFMSLSVLAGRLTGFYNMIVCMLGVIPACWFLPGLVMVARKYAAEKTFVPVLPTFFRAVKENFRQFLAHGFIIYAIIVCAYFAITFYGYSSAGNAVYSAVFSIYVIFVLVLAIMLFYVPLMSVTYELGIVDIYKNSLLLVVGAILRNLGALIYTVLFGAAAFLALVYTEGAARYILLGVITALLPLIIVYGVVSIIAKPLQDNVVTFTEKPAAKEPPRPKPVAVTEEEKNRAEEIGSEGGYVFVNGKMIKK